MRSNKLSLLALVFALLLGWMSSASGFGDSAQPTEPTTNPTEITTQQTEVSVQQSIQDKVQQTLEQPGATDRFTSEIAKGECGAMMGTLAESIGTDKEFFCSLMLDNADVFLAEDADHTPAGIAASIGGIWGQGLSDALEQEPQPEVPIDDLDNRPLDQFGDVDVPPDEPDMPLPDDEPPIPEDNEPPVPDDEFDCQTGDPFDDWHSHNC